MNEQPKWYSRDMHPETEAQALYDYFNGKVPQEGGNMTRLFAFFEGRPHIHMNDWKNVYEMALKIQHNAGTKRSRSADADHAEL